MVVGLLLATATRVLSTLMLIRRCPRCPILTICRSLSPTVSTKASQEQLEWEEHMEATQQIAVKVIIAKRITLPWGLSK
jgi:hypothetical protein